MDYLAQVLSEIIRAIKEKRDGAIATIVRTKGSTPAPKGSKMFISSDGSFCGSVGGGCLEAEVWAQAKEVIRSRSPRQLTFEFTGLTVEDDGMICGGKVLVFLEPLDFRHAAIYERALDCVLEGEEALLLTQISAPHKKAILSDSWKIATFETHNMELLAIDRMASRGDVEIVSDYLLEPLIGHPKLVIYGAGHISQAICKFAKDVGFHVTVVDDREDFANGVRFPEADRVLVEDLRNLSALARPVKNGYAVIVTRGHRYDAEVLRQLVKDMPKYVGMIGSKRKVRIVFDFLKSLGIDETVLNKVHAPIGLDIGARTPQEIALSIVAEMVKERRKRPHSAG
ncbi:MAG: XdhC family protein [Deltaproteobacteria bacterium]|nr:XdhC family protein [Deltaproteobacteria bacterium]